MGVAAGIETDTGEECPFWFTRSDSKHFYKWVLYGYPSEEFGRIQSCLNLTRDPLDKVAHPDGESLDYLMVAYRHSDLSESDIRQHQSDNIAKNEAAWQSPQDLIDYLQELITAIDEHIGLIEELQITEPYFADGIMRQDLLDVLRMAEWAQEKGIHKIRFTASH